MKLGVFTDCHYCSKELSCGNRYCNQSLEKLRRSADVLKNCDAVVCLGDVVDAEPDINKTIGNLKEFSRFTDGLSDFFCLMGNHDAELFSKEDFAAVSGFRSAPFYTTVKDRQFIFLDCNYTKEGNRCTPEHRADWRNTALENFDVLREALSASDLPAYVFMHQGIDPELNDDHRLYRADEVRALLEASGRVKAVFQGHYHPGMRHFVNGIDYITLPALCCIDDGYCFVFDI